jgi:glycosyltransferase involved in cell wall biosynthesis
MTEQLLLSVIIPTRNRAALLPGLVESLRAQTLRQDRFEVIFIDDGSTDNTSTLLAEIAAQPPFRFARQHHTGPAAARNHGAHLAIAEILVFTDDDCLPSRGWLSALAESFPAPADAKVVAVGGKIENSPSGSWANRFITRQNIAHQINNLPTPLYLDTANAAFLRRVFDEIGGFNPAFPTPNVEDVDFSLRLVAAGYQLASNQAAIVIHAGKPTLAWMLRRNFQIGSGFGILMLDHPGGFRRLPQRSLLFKLQAFLARLRNSAWQTAPRIRPLLFALAAVFTCLLFSVAVSIQFVLGYLPLQFRRYRTQGLGAGTLLVYLFVEVASNLFQLAGQFYGAFRYAWMKASNRDDEAK